MIQQQQAPRMHVYYQMSTNNKSFLNMHYYLKSIGIKNNKFMLTLLDPDLDGIDPFDRNLPPVYKQKILREVMYNYWYFLREVVRIPDQGSTSGGARYKLDRGNLALNFCMMLNLNIFLELPRQIGKTISSLCRYLWVFNFGTTNSEMVFLNKKMDDSKLNLARMKEIRDALPSYLQMKEMILPDGKVVKKPNTVETLEHVSNGNKIKTVPSARSKAAAASLLRGRTIPIIYADEWAFTPYNDIIYVNTIPAWKTAAMNAKKNNAPYGITITTTPGFLAEDAGKYAYDMKESATPFTELWYDMTYNELMNYINANTRSSFIYIKYTYQQLGRSEHWFAEICKDMQNDWPSIRREILLEWANGVENSPFTQEDLEVVQELTKTPIKQVMLMNKYIMNIYQQVDLNRYPPIIGVDVSGGYNRDSSAISVIDSHTTKLFADMNCNYISTFDLAQCIYELVTNYMPNAVVNVERNGGYGASVLSKLVNSKIKRNLYFEIKDKVIEERQQDNHIYKAKKRMKVYGLDSSKKIRELLMEILRERMEYHKDKFVSPIILEELKGLEVKKNGKIDHSVNTHDDQIFSLLMALYVWYYGKNLTENFGIKKGTIKTDESLDEEVKDWNTATEFMGDVIEDFYLEDDNSPKLQANKFLRESKQAIGKTYSEFEKERALKEMQILKQYLNTRVGREAYARTYHLDIDELNDKYDSGLFEIPPDIFASFYDTDINTTQNNMYS